MNKQREASVLAYASSAFIYGTGFLMEPVHEISIKD